MKFSQFAILATLFVIIVLPVQAGIWGKGIEGNGNVITETRDLTGFTAIRVDGSIDVIIIQSDVFKVSVEAEENLMKIVHTDVSADTLVISTSKNYNTSEGITVTIEMPNLTKASLRGSGDLTIKDNLSGKRLDLSVWGSGDVTAMDCSFDELECLVNGSGDVRIGGTAGSLLLSVNGSGDIDASRLKAQDVVAKVNGSGDIDSHAEKSLKAKVNGSGDISYSGDAKVTKSIDGSGDIMKK